MHVYGYPVFYTKTDENGKTRRRRVYYLQEVTELEGMGWEREGAPDESGHEEDAVAAPALDEDGEGNEPAETGDAPLDEVGEVLVPEIEDEITPAAEVTPVEKPTELEFMNKSELIEYGRAIGAKVSISMSKQAIVDTLQKSEPRFTYPEGWAPPKKAKRFDRLTASDGSEWVFDQPRLKDGRYEHDDPETPELESALAWLPAGIVD